MEGGNEAASKVWEASLSDEERITPDVGDYEREKFIRDKYERMRWRSSAPAAALHPHPVPREDKAVFDLIDLTDPLPAGGGALPSSTSSSSSAACGGVGGGSHAAGDLHSLGVMRRGAGAGSGAGSEGGQNDAQCRLIEMKMMMMECGGGGQGGGWLGGGGIMGRGMPMGGGGGGGGMIGGGGMMGGVATSIRMMLGDEIGGAVADRGGGGG